MGAFCRVCLRFYAKCTLFDGRLCSEYFDKVAGLPFCNETSEKTYVCQICSHKMRRALKFRDTVRSSNDIFKRFLELAMCGKTKLGQQVDNKNLSVEFVMLDMNLSVSQVQCTNFYGEDDPMDDIPDEGRFEDLLKDWIIEKPEVKVVCKDEVESTCERIEVRVFYNENSVINDLPKVKDEEDVPVVLLDEARQSEEDNSSDYDSTLASWTRKRNRKSAKRKKKSVSKDVLDDEKKYDLVLLSRDEQIAEMIGQGTRKSYCFAAHRCDKCYTSFTHEKYYKQHKPRHDKETDYYCDICQSYFLTIHKLNLHTNVVHLKRYQCTLCNCRLKDRSLIIEHYNLEHMGIRDNHKCGVCEKSFSKLSTLKRHLCKQEKVKCKECGKIVTKLSLRSHEITHVAREKRYECSLCPGRFLSTSNLRAHEKLKHSSNKGKDSFYCIECDLTFKSEEILKRHLTEASRHATDEHLKQCPLCPAKLPKWGVKTHVNKVHLNVKPHQCDLCPKAFFNRNSMVLHRRTTHEGIKSERKYICEKCGKAFVNKRVLTDHSNMHTGLRPYQCKICDADFTHEAARYNHVQLVHLRMKKANKRGKKVTSNEGETAIYE